MIDMADWLRRGGVLLAETGEPGGQDRAGLVKLGVYLLGAVTANQVDALLAPEGKPVRPESEEAAARLFEFEGLALLAELTEELRPDPAPGVRVESLRHFAGEWETVLCGNEKTGDVEFLACQLHEILQAKRLRCRQAQ